MPYSDKLAAHPSLRIAVVQFAPKVCWRYGRLNDQSDLTYIVER